MNVTDQAKGVFIGRVDADGSPIHIGDALGFDPKEWGGEMRFTIELIDGEIVHPGSSADLSEWCRVVKRWDEK